MQSITRRKRHIKLLITFFLVAALVLAVGAAIIFSRNSAAPQNKNPKATTQRTKEVTKIRLIASGDELAHDTVNNAAKTGDSYDYKPFFSEVKPIFDKADIRFCNQEVPSAAPTVGAVSGYPVFNAPTEFARDLSSVGCNVINTATNHTNDKLQSGINTTLDTWDKLPKLAIAGANRSEQEQQKIRYFTVKGVKFAFLAYNYESNNKNLTNYGVNMFDEALMSEQLSEAKKQGAYSLVSVHWGTENSPNIDTAQEKWSQFLADNGADVVLGTGPHVLGPVKKLPRAGGGETLVWYSLGNMLNTQLEAEGLISGFAVMDFTVEKNKATLDSISFLPTYMHYEWTAAQKASQDLLARTNLKIYLLESAAEPLGKSQNNTTVEAQTERIKTVLNTFTAVPIITSKQY